MNVDQDLGWNTTLTLSWLGSFGRELPSFVDTNLPAPVNVTYTVVNNNSSGLLQNGAQFTTRFSPPRMPAEKAKLTFSSISGDGENIALPIRFQIEGPRTAADVSTSRGKTWSPRIQPYVPSGSSTRK